MPCIHSSQKFPVHSWTELLIAKSMQKKGLWHKFEPAKTLDSFSFFPIANIISSFVYFCTFQLCLFWWLLGPITYLQMGVILDRTLSYKKHLTKTAAKLKRRNCLLFKPAGIAQRCSLETLGLGLETPRRQERWSWSWGKSLGLDLGFDNKVLTFLIRW